jgi:hypothetical protein
MAERNELLAKPASKLKMVECKALLGCKETEWTEIGAIVNTTTTVILHGPLTLNSSYLKSQRSLNYLQYHGPIKNTKTQQRQPYNVSQSSDRTSPKSKKKSVIVTNSSNG